MTSQELDSGSMLWNDKLRRKKRPKPRQQKQEPKPGTVSAAELAVQEAGKGAILGQSDQVGARFQGDIPSEPTYDLLQEADTKIAKLQQQVGLFEYHRLFPIRLWLK